MSPPTQAVRRERTTAPIALTTPLPADALRVEGLTHFAALSMLEETRLRLLSEDADLSADDLLGQPVALAIAQREAEPRHLHGYVARFAYGHHHGRYHAYQAEVVPWLWFLTQRSDCRIFQDMDVQQIVETVFKDHHAAIANYEFSLTRKYRQREYCVQYRESDFNFVARLLEEEGIYWYFEHGASQHRLLLVDAASAHLDAPGAETLPYHANVGQRAPDVEFVTHWHCARQVRSGRVALNSYDFERPNSGLSVALGMQRDHPLSDYEAFDFQGDFRQGADGEQLLDNRLDELLSGSEQVSGLSNAHGLAVGHLFNLTRHPRADQNTEYLVTQTHISARLNGSEAGGSHADFSCAFAALPAAQQFRPQRRTRKPFVQGPQSAVVTGPKDKEIFTDKFGRVKVLFHWDRQGKPGDSTTSCWMRVSQAWAGKSFGAIHIPRIGQEVIVDFLEGDPDQPLVTGRVYNADQTPPWPLPDNATQSGILTRSSKGGAYGNANALRFEDKKGAEQVWLHAERNLDTSVEHDESRTVGHDQTTRVGHHQKLNVKKGREVYVEEDGETYYVKGERQVYVDGKQTQTVTDDYDTFVESDRREFTGGQRTCWTQGDYVFKSRGSSYFDAGSLNYLTAKALKFNAVSTIGVQAGGAFHARADGFRFNSLGDIDFTGVKFNRVVMEANDTIHGSNTNTYVGVSRDVAIGPATEVYSGQHVALTRGTDVSTFLGLQVSTVQGTSISNSLRLACSNAALNLGFTGIDLATSGFSLNKSAICCFDGGGPISEMVDGAIGTVATYASVAMGLWALQMADEMSESARCDAEKDLDRLLSDPLLTDAVKARLRAIRDRPFESPNRYPAPNESDARDQARLLTTIARANDDKVPGTTPLSPPAAVPNDPTSGLGPPATPASPFQPID